VEAVARLGERRFSNVQKMEAFFQGAPRNSFHDVRRHRIRGTPHLAARLARLTCPELT